MLFDVSATHLRLCLCFSFALSWVSLDHSNSNNLSSAPLFGSFSQTVSFSCLHTSPEHFSNLFLLLFGCLSASDFFCLHQQKKVNLDSQKLCVCVRNNLLTHLALRFFFRATLSGSDSRDISGSAKIAPVTRAGRSDSRSTKLPTIASFRNLLASCKRAT